MRSASRNGVEDHGNGPTHERGSLFGVLGGQGGVSYANDRDRYGRSQASAPHGGPADAARRLQSLAGDERLAVVFRQIRAILNLTETDMARRLGTGVDVVLSFEAGVVDALPPWPETARLIERYATMGDIDPAPLLGRVLSLQTLPSIPPPPPRQQLASAPAPLLAPPIAQPLPASLQALPPTFGNDISPPMPAPAQPLRQLFDAAVPPTVPQMAAQPTRTLAVERLANSPSAAPAPPQAPAPAPAPAPALALETPLGFAPTSRLRTAPAEPNTARTRPPAQDASDGERRAEASVRRRSRVLRTVLVLSPLLLIAALFASMQVMPRPVYALANTVPGMRGLVDTMALQTATFKDGLRWLDQGDPRMRKGNRLN